MAVGADNLGGGMGSSSKVVTVVVTFLTTGLLADNDLGGG
jgi:hypothetical protein